MSKIPKRISFFWVGRLSWLRWITLDTFVRLNPDWEISLYTTPKDMVLPKHWKSVPDDDNSYRGEDYWDRVPSCVQIREFEPPCPMASAQMCDLFQWNLLATEGGIYADMDVLWLRPLSDALSGLLGSDIILCLADGLLSIGLVGSSPSCEMFRHVVDNAKVGANSDYQYYGTNLLYRLYGRGKWKRSTRALIRRIRKFHPHLNLAEMSHTIYPFSWKETGKIFNENSPVPDAALGIHWFGGCPISNKWNNLLTEKNWLEHMNTLRNCLLRLENAGV